MQTYLLFSSIFQTRGNKEKRTCANTWGYVSRGKCSFEVSTGLCTHLSQRAYCLLIYWYRDDLQEYIYIHSRERKMLVSIFFWLRAHVFKVQYVISTSHACAANFSVTEVFCSHGECFLWHVCQPIAFLYYSDCIVEEKVNRKRMKEGMTWTLNVCTCLENNFYICGFQPSAVHDLFMIQFSPACWHITSLGHRIIIVFLFGLLLYHTSLLSDLVVKMIIQSYEKSRSQLYHRSTDWKDLVIHNTPST